MAIDTTSPRTRRALLTGTFGGLAALAAQALRPLAARAEGEVIHVGDDHHTATTATWLKNTTTDNDVFRAETTKKGRGLYGISRFGSGVEGRSRTVGVRGVAISDIVIGTGVVGVGDVTGVRGTTKIGYGVYGESETSAGVYGYSVKGTGVRGDSFGDHGVVGSAVNDHGASVLGYKGSGHTGNAIMGEIDVPASPSSAIVGTTAGPGNGIRGTSAKGRGGLFQGRVAQIRLDPSGAATHPATGAAGDLFVDKGGRLWFCKGGTTWKQLA